MNNEHYPRTLGDIVCIEKRLLKNIIQTAEIKYIDMMI